MTMGEKILKLRKARQWNQEDLAEQIGVTRQAVSRWESDSAKPDADKIISLCDLFGVSADYLLREQYTGDGPVVRETVTVPEKHFASNPPRIKNGPNTRQLFGFGLFALGLFLLFAMELVGILRPHTHYTDHGTYYGFQAYVQLYQLHWMVWLLAAMICGGIVLMLLDSVKSLFQKLRSRKTAVDSDPIHQENI